MQAETTSTEISSALAGQISLVSETCKACGICVKECQFLKDYGNPKEIAESYGSTHQCSPFECSLCGLCHAVCPFDVDPTGMFLEMRREKTRENGSISSDYKIIRNYENRGVSPEFSYYGLPEGCDTVFFPGCALPGTRPDKTIKLFDHLQKNTPNLGIILDCCTKPSYDLGDENYFDTLFAGLKEYLDRHNIKKVIVACPTCYRVFKEHGDSLQVTTAYEELDKDFEVSPVTDVSPVTIHDPCIVRFDTGIQDAVRSLIAKSGFEIQEMEHTRENTICCGEGGSVGFCRQELAKAWSSLRKHEAKGRKIITYCAGCANYLNPVSPTSHLLDLLMEPEMTMAGQEKVSRSPFTYLNRLKVKKYFRENLKVSISGTRPENPLLSQKKKSGTLKRLGLLTLLAGAIIAIRTTGLDSALDQEKLRQLVQGYGAFGPLVFMALYTVAPSLFLPGLPFAVVAGVLFGPFWGVVYAITGATLGATLAFLISRYTGRQWLEEKLTGPKLQQLDRDVERLGWKMVAFTRLIPIFPFNLLNYAFGLTRIRLLHYVLASFFFMLPGCIAYILLSSSLLDLLKGTVSPVLVAGILVMTALSLLPVLYKKYKARR